MTDIPEAAIEAAADGLARYCPNSDAQGVRCDGCMEQARAVIAAAMPAIREAIAQAVDEFRKAEQIIVSEYETGLRRAANIVRGAQ